MAHTSILGLFEYVDRLLSASKRLNAEGYDVTIISPVPLVHEIEHVEGEKKSPLRFFTLFGGISGWLFGTLLTLGTSALYVLPRGGRPIFAITPTLLISYETTILGGVIMSFVGFFVLAGLPYFEGLPHYRGEVECPDAAIDAFGLIIEGVTEDKHGYIKGILKDCGSVDVKTVDPWPRRFN